MIVRLQFASLLGGAAPTALFKWSSGSRFPARHMVRNVQRVSVMFPATWRDRIVRGDELGFMTMRIRSRHLRARRRRWLQIVQPTFLKGFWESEKDDINSRKHIVLRVQLVDTCLRLDYITASDTRVRFYASVSLLSKVLQTYSTITIIVVCRKIIW